MANPSSPREKWNDYFSKRTPQPDSIRKLVLKLHNKKQYEESIAVIESALIHGQSQPWMYDILAISMRLAGYPKQAVERVLLSRVDFTATDIPSMLYSAAYLTRFDAKDRALSLYEQAAKLDPTRPEPYVLALKLAVQMRNAEAVRWAAPGVLNYAWTQEHPELHKLAENAAADVLAALKRDGETKTAAEFAKIMNAARQRDISCRLSWNGPGDLDLLVEDPSGAVCSTSTPRTGGGGVLVHDGSGPRQENCYDEYVCPRGLSGTYKVRVRHIRGNIVGKRATLTVTRYAGTDHQSTSKITVEPGVDDVVVQVPLNQGRLKKAAVVPQEKSLRVPENRTTSKRNPRAISAAASRRFQKSRSQSPLMARDAAMKGAGGFGFVGYQPIISVVPEGVSLTVGAVISADRRYVRLTLNPSFSAIADVATFSFFRP